MAPTTMNYNQIVSSLRTAARDMLRMQKTNEIRDELLALNTELNKAQKEHEAYITGEKKRVAVATYKLGLVEDSDPEATEKREALAKMIELCTKNIDASAEHILEVTASLEAKITAVNERIARVQSGETLMDKALLSQVTSGFINEVASEAVKSKLMEEVAKDVEVVF